MSIVRGPIVYRLCLDPARRLGRLQAVLAVQGWVDYLLVVAGPASLLVASERGLRALVAGALESLGL